MKKFDDIWKKANEEAELNYEPKGTISLLVFFKEALEKRIDTLLEKQQPEIPEFVADEIYFRRYVSSSSGIKPSDGLLLMEVFRDLNNSHGICRDGNNFKEGKFYQWMQSSENNKTFVEAILNGYTVAKEKWFYLKHIEMSKRDVHHDYYAQIRNERFEHDSVETGTLPQPVIRGVTFTQQEIDSMETGSYEQIEVEE